MRRKSFHLRRDWQAVVLTQFFFLVGGGGSLCYKFRYRVNGTLVKSLEKSWACGSFGTWRNLHFKSWGREKRKQTEYVYSKWGSALFYPDTASSSKTCTKGKLYCGHAKRPFPVLSLQTVEALWGFFRIILEKKACVSLNVNSAKKPFKAFQRSHWSDTHVDTHRHTHFKCFRIKTFNPWWRLVEVHCACVCDYIWNLD